MVTRSTAGLLAAGCLLAASLAAADEADAPRVPDEEELRAIGRAVERRARREKALERVGTRVAVEVGTSWHDGTTTGEAGTPQVDTGGLGATAGVALVHGLGWALDLRLRTFFGTVTAGQALCESRTGSEAGSWLVGGRASIHARLAAQFPVVAGLSAGATYLRVPGGRVMAYCDGMPMDRPLDTTSVVEVAGGVELAYQVDFDEHFFVGLRVELGRLIASDGSGASRSIALFVSTVWP